VVAVGFLQNQLGEGLSGEARLVHISLHKALLKEVVSQLHVLSAEALGFLRVVRHLLHFAAHSCSSDLLAEAATNELDVGVLVHEAPDEVLDLGDPADGAGVVDGVAAAWNDDGSEGLEVLVRGQLVLVSAEERPLLVTIVDKLTHEQSLVNVGPVHSIVTKYHRYIW